MTKKKCSAKKSTGGKVKKVCLTTRVKKEAKKVAVTNEKAVTKPKENDLQYIFDAQERQYHFRD